MHLTSWTRKSQQERGWGVGGGVGKRVPRSGGQPLSPQLPCGSVVVNHGQKRGRQAGPCLTLWAGPRPPLACCGLLNCVDFAGPVSQSTGWGRPPPCSLPVSGRMVARGTEVGSDGPPDGGTGQAGGVASYTVFIYLFSLGWSRAEPTPPLCPEPSVLSRPQLCPSFSGSSFGEPHPETRCWTQGSLDILALTHPCMNVSPLFCPQLCFGRVDK